MSVIMMSVTEAKQRFTEIVKRTQEVFDRILVTRNGKEAAVVMSAEEYESLLETIDVLGSKAEIRALAAASMQARKGDTISLEVYRSQKKSAGKKRSRR
ncbi:MAG: type II toxin-antitoxin system Phd/YefM family antitoxin [Ignavibacteriales bacterium]|nr:type II toxin-antitoxin system Phd/YefM family antitoxin [Ignavibacteriales bacterium]